MWGDIEWTCYKDRRLKLYFLQSSREDRQYKKPYIDPTPDSWGRDSEAEL